MDLAQTLKEFRQANGLEQDDLATLLDTTQQTVSNWESGTMPRSAALNRINHLLKTYKKGEVPPAWEPPTYHPAVTEIHEIPVDKEKQRQRLDVLRNAAAHGQIKGEHETRAYMAQSMARTIERSPRAEEYRYIETFRERVFSKLPPTLSYERDAMVGFHGVRTRADYLTARVCAEIKYSTHPGSSPVFDLGIHQLNTIREIHRRHGEQRAIYLLVVVTIDISGAQHRTNRLLNLAALHDIQLFITTSPEECAELLVALESGTTPEEDFLDE